MKKVFILAAIMILWAGTVFGAGTNVITSITPYAGGVTHVLTTFVADATDATVPDLIISGYRGQYICQIWSNPGTTQPTDNWDLYLKYDGGDVLQAGGENRDTANTEVTYPIIQASSNGGCAYIPGDLTLSISGNSVNSATATILLIFHRQGY
jgi:hypothetical protein